MESHGSTQLKVGIFLTIGVIFILGSIFFLGADKAIFRTYVKLHAQFEQVQGLSTGSVVSLSGVTVGNVQDITFVPEKNVLDVLMKIDSKYIDRVREGSQVEIRTQGALGDKFVFIIPGDPRNPQVKDGTTLDVAKPTDILGIISERGNETSKIFDIIDELSKMTRTINMENRLGKIMANFEVASANLKDTTKATQSMASQLENAGGGEKLRRSLERLDSILGKIDRGEGTLGALINDPTVHNQLKAFLGGSSSKSHVKSLLRTSIEKEE